MNNQVYFPLRTPIPTIINSNQIWQSKSLLHAANYITMVVHSSNDFLVFNPYKVIFTYSFLSFPLSPYNTLSSTSFVWIYMGSGLVSSPQIELYRIQLKTKTTLDTKICLYKLQRSNPPNPTSCKTKKPQLNLKS